MTILLGAWNTAALVMGADSQQSSAVATQTTRKLLTASPGLVFGWAGYKDVAQALILGARERPIDLARPRMQISREIVDRFREVRADPEVEHRGDGSEFMIGWYSATDRRPVAFRLGKQGAVEWIEGWGYAGHPQAIATAATARRCISYIDTEELSAEQLTIVTLKVLRDTIAVAPATALVGGPPQLVAVTSTGIKLVEAEELRGANDTLDLWESRSAELLRGAPHAPTGATEPDPGLRPPT